MRFMVVAMGLWLAQPAWAAPGDFGSRGFARLTSLLGYWEAKDPEGKSVQVWYKLISGGTTLHETLKFQDQPEMVTMYHLDGKDLLATHYCSANNQPRMRALPSDAKDEIRFEFRDITNLSSPDASHMRSLGVRFKGANRFDQSWTWRQAGKEETLPLKFERKRQAPTPLDAPSDRK